MLTFIPEEATKFDPATGDYTVSIVNNNDDQNEGDHCAEGSVQDNHANNNKDHANREGEDNYFDEDEDFEGNDDYDGDGKEGNSNVSNATEAAKSTDMAPTFSQSMNDVPESHRHII